MNTKDDKEYNFENVPLFSSPKNLPKKSPMRLLAIDKLEQGEEILPENFVLIFSTDWHESEIRDIKGIYKKIIPVIGICGKAVFLNSKYASSEVEKFLRTYRK